MIRTRDADVENGSVETGGREGEGGINWQSCIGIYILRGASQEAFAMKNPPANAEDIREVGLIPGLWRFLGEGNGNPPQYSCLENPHGQRSLAGYSLSGRQELDMTEAT